jgi:hypothetical protein
LLGIILHQPDFILLILRPGSNELFFALPYSAPTTSLRHRFALRLDEQRRITSDLWHERVEVITGHGLRHRKPEAFVQ